MTAAPATAGAGQRDPGRVLLLALLAWGTGHAALGERRTGWLLLAAELLALVVLVLLHVALAPTTMAIVPFLGGIGFLVAWGAQAVDAYRRARGRGHAIGPAAPRSSAATIVWLAVPLLLWWSLFWLEGGSAASAGAVLDRFLREAPRIAEGQASGALTAAIDPQALAADTAAALGALRGGCEGVPCIDASGATLLLGARVRLVSVADDEATAVLESVHHERRDTRFLGIFPGSHLVPVVDARLLVLQLEAHEVRGLGGIVGARQWVITDSRSMAGSP